MLKKLLLALLVLLCLVGGVVWYALTNASALIAHFKPQIEAAASAAVGAPVSFGDLETSIIPDARVVVDTVSIGGATGLSLKNLTLHLNLWALLGKRLEITELTLTEPTITVVQDTAGLSLEGLPKKAQGGSTPSSASVVPTPAMSARSSVPPLAIQLEKFALKNATVIFRDAIAKTERRVSSLDVVAGLDLDGPVAQVTNLEIAALLDAKLKLVASSKDISFEQARGRLSAPNVRAEVAGIPLTLGISFETKIGKGEVTARSTGVELGKLSNLGNLIPPPVVALGLTGTVVPDMKALVSPGSVNAVGTMALKDVGLKSGGFAVSKLNGDLALRTSANEQSIESKNLALALNGEPVTGSLNLGIKGAVVTLRSLELATAGGKIQSSGSLDQRTQALVAKLDLSNLDVARVLAVVKPGGPGALSGKLTRFQTSVSGKMGPTLPTTLSGSGSLLVNDGKLAGENIGGKVLKTATNLPFLTGSLFESLPPETKRALEAKDTVISSLSSSFSLSGGTIGTKDLALKSTLFDIAAAGRATFAGALDLGAIITFEKGLSGALAGKVKEVRMVLDKDGRLAVPLTIKGTAPNLSVLPDFAKLLQSNMGKVIEQKAGDALQNLLKKKPGSGRGPGGLLGF